MTKHTCTKEVHPLPRWFTPAAFAVLVIFAALVHYGPQVIRGMIL